MARLNQEYSSKRELILKQHASLHEYHLNAVKDKYKEDPRLIDIKLDDSKLALSKIFGFDVSSQEKIDLRSMYKHADSLRDERKQINDARHAAKKSPLMQAILYKQRSKINIEPTAPVYNQTSAPHENFEIP